MTQGAMQPRPASKPPATPAPLIDTSTSSPSMALMGDVINNVAAPFQAGPDPAKGALGQVEHVIGAVMGVVGAPFELMDTGFALATAPIAALVPGMPAAVLMMPHLGTPHGHAHPPSLIPPNPVPVPLPSIGTVMCAGCVSVTIGGTFAARAGDVGLAVTCGSLSPAFEIYTGSSNTWIGGSRAARMTDITRHCNPASAMGKMGAAMGAVGLVAGAAGAGGSANAGEGLAAAMQAAQVAADAAALAMSALLGKDPGVPPSLGAVMLGNPTVLIGGFPLPDLMDVLGAALKGLKKLGDAAGKSPTIKKLLAKVGLCNDPGEPVNSFSGVVYNDFEDYRAENGSTWERHYRSDWNTEDGELGFGFRHFYDRRLTLLRKRAKYETHDGEQVFIPRGEKGGFVTGGGFTLTERSGGRYLLITDRDEELEFLAQPTTPPTARLVRYSRKGVEVYLDYDAQARLRALTESVAGHAVDTRFRRDEAGRIIEALRGPRGGTDIVISRYTYENGCLATWQDALGATARMRYDAARRMVQGTDRRGYSFHWHYDPNTGRCIKSHGDDGLWGIEAKYEGTTSTFKEADGGEWTFKHFPDGVVSHILDPLGGLLEYVRDEETGRIVKQIMPGGVEYRWLYDRNGRHYARADQWAHQFLPEDADPEPRDPLAHDGPITHKGWLWGRPLAKLLPLVAGVPSLIASTLQRLAPYALGEQRFPTPVRNALGHIVEQTELDGSVRRFRRDGEGNIVAEQAGEGPWSRREMTSWNLIAGDTSPLGNTTRFAYTHREKPRSLIDPNGNSTEYVRDSLQRVSELRRHGGIYRTYTFDSRGALLEERDGLGARLVQYQAGPMGLHTSCALASGETYSYEYDSHGRLTKASSGQHDVELAHLRNLRVADRRDGQGVQHTYESWLSVLRTTYFDRFIVQYDYREGPGVRIRTPDGGRHFVWRTDSGVVVRENDNGTNEATAFDRDERLCARVCWRRDRATSFGSTWTESYSYSAYGELLSWSDNQRGPIGFDFDADHRLVAQTDHRGRRVYEYDRAGNLIKTPDYNWVEHRTGNLIDHAAFDHFEYDACHRVSRIHRHQRGAVNFSYDSKGQLVEARFENRDEVWRAAYDGLGRRLWRDYAGKRTDFYWDGDRLAAERFPDGKLRLYIYVNEDALVPFMWLDYASTDADLASGKAYYLFAGPSGMPVRVEDANGNIAWQVKSVDAYGTIEVDPRATVELRLRFAGHFYDEHLGLFYNRFRDYDPALGRYLQPDPIGHDGSINLYSYPPNPLADVDLRGLIHRKGPPGEGPEQTKVLKAHVTEDAEATKKGKSQTQLKRKDVMVAGVRNKKTGDTFTATNRDARAALDAGTLHPIVKERVKAVDNVISTHERLQKEGKSTADIHGMSDADLRGELAKDGVDSNVAGMDTTAQMRRVNDRVAYREGQARDSGMEVDQKKTHDSVRNENGNHGEVKATSDALDQLEMDRGGGPPPIKGPPPPLRTAPQDVTDLELHNQRLPDNAADPLPNEAYPRCDNCRGITEGVEPTPELRDAESAIDASRVKP